MAGAYHPADARGSADLRGGRLCRRSQKPRDLTPSLGRPHSAGAVFLISDALLATNRPWLAQDLALDNSCGPKSMPTEKGSETLGGGAIRRNSAQSKQRPQSERRLFEGQRRHLQFESGVPPQRGPLEQIVALGSH
jgi:hypothetical protein